MAELLIFGFVSWAADREEGGFPELLPCSVVLVAGSGLITGLDDCCVLFLGGLMAVGKFDVG